MNKKDLIKSSNSSAENLDITDVSRICRSVSKMQGMKYYSTSKKKEMVLYEKAYMIADENSKEPIPDKNKVKILFDELTAAFEKEETTKEEVIAIMKAYLPNFEHIETGRSLDSKM